MAGALAVGVGGWAVLDDAAATPVRSTPAEAVADFFLARSNGDCRLLIDVLTEESWSDGGRRDRQEFLGQCAEALAVGASQSHGGGAAAPSRPNQVDIEIVDAEGSSDPEGDRAAVTTTDSDYVGGAPDTYESDAGPTCPLEEETFTDGPCGMLVREGGEWKVEADHIVLRIGPSVQETVRGYLDAYDEGDCERLIGFLSEAAWSADGDRSRDEFLDQCATEVEAREGPGRPLSVEATAFQVSFEDDGRAAATVTGVEFGGGTTSWGTSDGGESVGLVREGLRWRLDGSEPLGDHATASAHMHVLRYVELQASLLDEIQVDGRTCFTFLERPVPGTGGDGSTPLTEVPPLPAGTDVRLGIGRGFGSCYAGVGVYQLASDDEARQAAEAMAQEIVEQELPTVEDLSETAEETGIGGDDPDLEGYVAGRRPNRRADVPGIPDAIGVESFCDVDGCSEATVIAAAGPLVVAVHLRVGDLAGAAPVLTAQRERL